MRFIGDGGHVHGGVERSAVVLINLGTPQAPTAPAVRRYLRQFLSDPRVVEIPRWIWWPTSMATRWHAAPLTWEAMARAGPWMRAWPTCGAA